MPIRAARHAVSLASPIIVGALYAGLTAMPAEAATYSVISNFNKVVGAQPSGGLTQVGKLLYGSAGLAGPANAGTVFSLKKSGRLAVVTGFSGSGNAVQPLGSLLNINGTLYGVSLEGGGGGVFFSVTPSGTETVLHSFGAGTDGRVPNAGLVYVNGVIYGTTMMGGTYNFGTLYDITLSGEEQVLANFGAASGDASRPSTGLTLLGGTLYGGAEAGGAAGYGAVYSSDLNGNVQIVHSFANLTEGYVPSGTFAVVNGVLYGTTLYGGTQSQDAGNVYSVTTTGVFSNVYAFKNGTDGSNPLDGVVVSGNVLYGTTWEGGAKNCAKNRPLPCGTIFSLTLSGQETVLHVFTGNGTDGYQPASSLLKVGKSFYGTTSRGGKSNNGVAFKIDP